MKTAVLRPDSDLNVRPWIWLVLAPWLVAACIVARYLPAWQLMGVLAIATLVFLKWLTIAGEPHAWNASLSRLLAYAFLWPGLDAKAFFATRKSVSPPRSGEWW